MTGPRQILTPSELAALGAFDDAEPWTARQRDNAAALYQWHHDWTADQVAAGVDGPVPAGRPAGSDYNQHVPDIESAGEAEDRFHREAQRILGLPPA